ncbi:hypothetical protein GCM10025787_14240 [Saccharopolyspora rosea]
MDPTPAPGRSGRPDGTLLDLVREQVADLLGYDDRADVATDASFLDLGMDSLTAVDLRDRLTAACGIAISSTVVFDHPTPVQLAAHLETRVGNGSAADEPGAAGEPVSAADEPIAIVGMACRLPGGVESPEDLWRLVSAGGDGVGPFPDDRGWDLESLYDPDPDRQGTSYVREGGFLDHALDFDAGFFGVPPREAEAMDPQQRLLLETSWEALERAGIDPSSLRGSRTGVYAGIANFDFPAVAKTVPDGDMYRITGTHNSVASGRVAYVLGLEGPALTVDTACSSSLVTMHLAAQALRHGECSLALAGGATVLAGPDVFLGFCRQRALSRDGRCRAFAAASDGFGPAEGAGVVVLERLSDARRNGHRVLAVLRGSAVNQDGASNGLTAPNGPSQQRVIRQALANAALSPSDVDVVEAHGTGTPLGDPIEAQALLATYGADREHPLLLGSVKSNIGHTQAAAGVAGVIKAVLALRHGTVPATLHVDEPSPHVDWSSGAVELVTEPVPWPAVDRPRRAAVSSFGISGTNAHVILEQGPETEDEPSGESGALDGTVLWPVSGRSEAALRAQAGRLADFLATDPAGSDSAIAGALARSRTAFEHRAVVVARDRASAVADLRALADGRRPARAAAGSALDGGVVLVFPGQGAQWRGMGRELLESSPEFADWVAECEEAFAPYLDWSLTEVLRGDPNTPLESVEFVQPALFAMMTGLAGLWRSCGVHPAAVVGHSQGEIAAAFVAGALTLPDAARVVCSRSRLLTDLVGRGAMASVPLGRDEVERRLSEWDGRISVAAINSAELTVVCGEPDAVARFVTDLDGEGIRARHVPMDRASHSAQIDVLEEPMRQALAGLRPRSSGTAFCSSVTGDVLDTAGLDGDYWYRNLRQPVEFQAAARTLVEQGHRIFLEVGPHPVLTAPLEQILHPAPRGGAVLGTLRRGEGGFDEFAGALARAHVSGVDVDWSAVLGVSPVRTDLPTYAFQRERHWPRPPAVSAADPAALGLHAAGHPLLGAAVDTAEDGATLLTGRIALRTHPWLADHAVAGTALLPGTAFVELAARAGRETGCEEIAELVLEAPLPIPDEGHVQLQVRVSAADEAGRRALAVHSRPGDPDVGPWTRHATGVLSPAVPGTGTFDVPGDATPVDVEDFYAQAATRGYDYGPAFRGLSAMSRRDAEILAEARLPEAAGDAGGYLLHPALLDAALHPVALDAERARLPFSWRGVVLHAPGASVARVRLVPVGPDAVALTASDVDGRPVVSVAELTLRPVATDQLAALRGPHRDALFSTRWQQVDPPAPSGTAAVLGEDLAVPGAERHRDLAALLASLDAGGTAPDVVFAPHLPGSDSGADTAERVRTATCRALALLQTWLADERLADSRLVVVTRGALAAGPDEGVADLAHAALWGLVGSARSEHGDRFALVDTDEDAASVAALPAAAATGEPQLAVRAGAVRAPRLVRAAATGSAPEAPDGGTVLITGGTGALGSRFARHLVAERGIRHLLLVGRRGPTPDSAELERELTELGAQTVTTAACDVGDRDALARLLDAIPADRPLTGVVHAAGVLDDGVIGSLDPQRVARVLRPKADAALHLHELTEHLPLRWFVLFSSVAGALGAPGQGNYAAANTLLEALAYHRRAAGLPATALAWGYWEDTGGLTEAVDQEALAAQLRRIAMLPLRTEQGLALFDAASATGEPVLTTARVDVASLSERPTVPPLLSGLVRSRKQRSSTGTGSTDRMAALSGPDREAALLDLVRDQVCAVLGRFTPDEIAPDRPLPELGFDSLTAIQLRTALAEATGLRLSPTVVFDHPTPEELARELGNRLAPADPEPAATGVASAHLDSLETALEAADPQERDEVLARLGALLAAHRPDDLAAASDEELFELIDDELGAN